MQDILVFLIFILFFILNMVFTQRIYSSNKYLLLLFLFSLCVLVLSYVLSPEKNDRGLLCFSSILLTYSVLLLFTRSLYKKINAFLIRKKLIGPAYKNKEFTYVHLGDYGNSWWNEKLATKPSWLDYLLTVILLLLPILLVVIVYNLLK